MTTAFHLRLPEDLYNVLRAEAFAKKTSVNKIITKALVDHVDAGRDELVEVIGRETNERFADVLDRLAKA